MTKANELLCLGLDSVLFALDPRSTQVNKLQSQIRYASQILERDIQNPPSVVELSKIVKLPTDTLTREFWNTYGVSISEFLLNQRMAVACHTLVTTDLPLKKISYEVGYRHTSNFCAAFKRHFGRTPTEVRRQGSQHVNQKTIPHNQNTLARYRKNRSITYREPLLDAYSRRESV